MQKASETVTRTLMSECLVFSSTLLLFEFGRVIIQGGDHLLLTLSSIWGPLWVCGGLTVLMIRLMKALIHTSWPQFKAMKWTEVITLITFIMIFSTALVYLTQWSVKWSSAHFRQPLYRGLFAGLTALAWSLFSFISVPALWRLCHRSLTSVNLSLQVPHKMIVTVIFFGSLALSLSASWIITTLIFPSLATVDLRLPQLLLCSIWALAYLPNLLGQYLARLQQYRVYQPLLLLIALSLVGSFYQASTLTPTRALRVHRDTSLVKLIFRALERASDQDGDGIGSLWGGGDCDDHNPKIRPGVPDKYRRVDLNCNQVISGQVKHRNFTHQSNQTESPKAETLNPKNLILLTIDALRYDAYLEAMPETRRFASRALDFTNAYSAGAATYWSIPALLGSRPPSFFKMGRDQTPVNTERLLTESLRDGRFHTALFANVTIFFVRGLSQGAYTKNYDTSHYTIHGAKPGAAHLTDGLIKHIDRWRKGQLKPRRDRFMLWGHYYDPHEPYFELEGYPAGNDHQRYIEIVRSVDRELGRLYKALKDRQLLEETVIVITADHGDEFGDHGHRFHGKTLYDEMVKVPLLIYSPQYEGRKISDVFSHLDVAPTLLSHLGLKAEDRFMGRDWDTELRSKQALKDSQAFFEVLPDQNYARHLVGLRRGEMKLIAHVDRNAFELYNLREDPEERYNLADQPTESTLYRPLIGYIERQLRQLARGEARVKLPR